MGVISFATNSTDFAGISSEFLPKQNRARMFCFTFITDEGKKQDDEAAAAEEPEAEEAGAASGSAAGK